MYDISGDVYYTVATTISTAADGELEATVYCCVSWSMVDGGGRSVDAKQNVSRTERTKNNCLSSIISSTGTQRGKAYNQPRRAHIIFISPMDL
jgi:hypothetical protein